MAAWSAITVFIKKYTRGLNSYTIMFKDFLLLALKSTRHRPLRSWLTIAGIVIGVMLVVVIFSLSSGAKSLLSNMLQMFGSELLFVLPGKETDPLAGIVGGQRFKESDLKDLERIPGVEFSMPADVGVLNVEYKGEKKTSMVHGIPWKPFRTISEESQGVKVRSGVWPQQDDTREVMLGYLVADKLFKQRVRVGDEVTIKSKRLRVVGIFGPMGSQEDDNSFFISLDMFHELVGQEEGAISAFVKVESGADVDLVARQVRFELSKQEDVRDFAVLTPGKANQLVGDILGVVEFILFVIALVSLVVGAVGIMNTMYTSVLERTRHIGIMKAVGASEDSILSLFLIESGAIGLIGGIMGIALGIVVAYGVGLIAQAFGVSGIFSFAALNFFDFFVVLVITFITGIIAGYLPARTAAKMEPAEALRYE